MLLLRVVVVVVLGVVAVANALSRYKSKNMFKSPRVLIRGWRTRWLAVASLHEFLPVKLHDRPTERHTTRDRSRPRERLGASAADSPQIQHPSTGAPFVQLGISSSLRWDQEQQNEASVPN